MHREMYNTLSRDYLIFGAPLDIAVAADTKFDVLFANKVDLFDSNSRRFRLSLIFGTTEMIRNILSS